MNLKEAITEIEKRYKKGDVIPCLITTNDDKINYTHWGDFMDIDTTDNEIFVQREKDGIMIMHKGEWAEPIREKKSLWGFFESVKVEYPNLAEEYLRECGERLVQDHDTDFINSSFSWSTSKSGSDYWDRISDLSIAYFEED